MLTFLLVLLGVSSIFADVITKTPLDDYVWAQDDNYNWEVIGETYHGKGYTGYYLNMTSQSWLTPEDFSPGSYGHIWYHTMFIIVPAEVDYKNNATLWITGGNTGDSLPDPSGSEDIEVTLAWALHTKTVAGILFQIPNQHITFSSDPIQKARSEDAIIAFTWDHFLKDPSQPNWLVRFPMVKASLRAMDAMKEFAESHLSDLDLKLDYFCVAGASKRGWTTWLVGAVDPTRVVAIVPVVLDAINFVEFSHHQFKAYNGWTFALSDYIDMNIMTRLDTPEMKLLQQYEDPYFYKERLTMPKFIVNAALDEFQMPDDTSFWWNDMPEPKHFLMTPNAEHSLATGIFEVVPTVAQWVLQLLKGDVEIPEFKWTISPVNGEITVNLNNVGVVKEARVYWATSCGVNTDGSVRRDFRVAMLDDPCTCGRFVSGTCGNTKSLWHQEVLNQTVIKPSSNPETWIRQYRAHFDAPTQGRYVASFIAVKYVQEKVHGKGSNNMRLLKEVIPRDLDFDLEFTSEVSIFPRVYPFADCYLDSCIGTMV